MNEIQWFSSPLTALLYWLHTADGLLLSAASCCQESCLTIQYTCFRLFFISECIFVLRFIVVVMFFYCLRIYSAVVTVDGG